MSEATAAQIRAHLVLTSHWEFRRRCALLADVQAIAAAETSSALDPHSDTPATVEAVSVAHSDGE